MRAARFLRRFVSAAALLALGFFATLACGCRLAGFPTRESRATEASRDLCNRGMRAMTEEKWDDAEDLLAQAVDACPNDPEARMRHADALWGANRSEEAIAEVAEAIRLAEKDAAPLVRMSQMQLEIGQSELAGRAANRAIGLDPSSAGAWRARGRAYAAVDEHRRALEDFQRALSFAKDDRDILLDVAQTYWRLGKTRRMLAVVERLKDAYPPGETPRDVLFLEGLAHQSNERHERAAICFESALAKNPEDAEISRALAMSNEALRPGASRRAARDNRRQPSR